MRITPSNSLKFAMSAGVAASLVVAPGWGTIAESNQASTPVSLIASPSPAIRNDSIYADGVYTATGYYGSLPSSITVTVTLADGIVTAVTVTPHATNPTSLDLQRRFAAAVPAVVVGKSLDEVNVGRLAGSTGTPQGFNAAIEQIKEQARIAADEPE